MESLKKDYEARTTNMETQISFEVGVRTPDNFDVLQKASDAIGPVKQIRVFPNWVTIIQINLSMEHSIKLALTVLRMIGFLLDWPWCTSHCSFDITYLTRTIRHVNSHNHPK
ncbi:hypothetical protein LguiA_004625 [Lonicera macranthoides]